MCSAVVCRCFFLGNEKVLLYALLVWFAARVFYPLRTIECFAMPGYAAIRAASQQAASGKSSGQPCELLSLPTIGTVERPTFTATD
jgi:hypothetical protein